VPELPEVETVRAGLEQHVVGRTIAAVEVLNPRAVRRDLSGPDGFAAAMVGRTFLGAERRGKYLWLDTSRGDAPPYPPAALPRGIGQGIAPDADGRSCDDDPPYPPAALPRGIGRCVAPATDGGLGGDDPPTEALLAHLGMSGQFLVGDPERPLSPHVRARFTFTDGGPDLRFTDQRTFGHLMLCSLSPQDLTTSPCVVGPAIAGPTSHGQHGGGRLVPEPIVHIAPDPLEAAFDATDFAVRLARKKTQVKRALLDQSLISGIGNIYADEALWRAKLHWARPTETLKPAEVSRLLEAVRDVLTEALKAGGTSFDALYVNVNGESGYFDRSLNAYGREGEPCGRCATPIRRDAFMNRSSYSCPRCQRPTAPRQRGAVTV
jgi:formamidopyrimidine-DNA glycosylase